MGSWMRAVAGVALVALVALVGIAASFGLLRLTQNSHDPVGKLSPRAVFIEGTRQLTTPGSTHDRDDGSVARPDLDD